MDQGAVLDPQGQAATPPQAGFIRCPVLHLERHLGDVVAAIVVVLVRHWAARERKEASILSCPRPSECTNAMRHTFAVPPPVDPLRIHLPTSGHVRNTRARLQRFPDDRRLLRRRPTAATDRSDRHRNPPVVTLRIVIAVKHHDRPKLPSASGKTNTSAAAVKEGRRNTAY